MFCKQCGVHLNDGTAFCANCGAKHTENPAPVATQPQTQPQQSSYAQPGYQPNVAQQLFYGVPGAGPQGGWYYGAPAPLDPQQFVPSNGSVDFGQAIKLFFTNYVNFEGRATRSEYWYAVLFKFIVGFVLGLIPVVGWVMLWLVSIGFYIPNLAIQVRRLHDIGKPWPWILFGLIPFAGPITLIVLYCKDSVGDNQWGRGPVTYGAPYYQIPYQNPAQQPPYAGAQPQTPYGIPTPNPAQQNVPPVQNKYPYNGQQ